MWIIARRPNELATYQKKIVEIDKHMGMAMSGLTADARALSKCNADGRNQM